MTPPLSDQFDPHQFRRELVEGRLASDATVWVYDDRLLVLSAETPVRYAMDVSLQGAALALDVTGRDEQARALLAQALRSHSEMLPTGKFRLGMLPFNESRRRTSELIADAFSGVVNAVSAVALERNRYGDFVVRDRSHGAPVTYTSKPRRGDTDRIIFIFTSIRTERDMLDFDGPSGKYLAGVRAELVFIYDDFAEQFAYYRGQDRSSDHAGAIKAFIQGYAAARSVPLERVTLAGMSKGGSASLMIGLQLPGATIVSLVPQFSIGDYLVTREEDGDRIMATIAGGSDDESKQWLNSLVPQAVEDARGHVGSVYILTSAQDENCFTGVMRAAGDLSSFAHLNVVLTDSRSASNHYQTLKYHTPLMISLLGMVSSGVTPDLSRANGPMRAWSSTPVAPRKRARSLMSFLTST